MDNKILYIKPEVEIIRFSTEKVLESSGGIELPDHEWSLKKEEKDEPEGVNIF